MATLIKEQFKSDPINLFDVEQVRARCEAFVKETNDFMQNYRVLCTTTDKLSEHMWKTYAENHKGIVLRVEPCIAKNSKFELFRPVAYRGSRPSLFHNALDFFHDSLFGDREATTRAILDTIIYSKTLEWQYENEYRLAIRLADGEDYDALPYHPEE